MNSVTVAHAKTHLSEILDKVATGNAVTITRRGKPVAVLQPVNQPKRVIDLARVDQVRARLPRARTKAVDLLRSIRSERD